MRRSRGLLIGMVVALAASVAGIVAATAPAFATVSAVTVNAESATEGTALPNTTTVATFASNTPNISTLSATIDWGDGPVTAGTVTSTGGTSYKVTGGFTYLDEG